MKKKQLRIRALYPNYFRSYSVSYTCISVLSAMAQENVGVSVMGISSDPDFKSPYYTNGIPSLIAPIAYRILGADKLRKLTELRFFSGLQKQDVAYLWPSTSLAMFEKIKNKGNKILVENINCHQVTSRKILEAECARLGVKFDTRINEAAIKAETTKLALCDYVFSPSINVTVSLIDSGVPAEKIIATSYGLAESDILPYRFRQNKENEPLTAVFVGRVGIRKGIHLLLDYWDKANVNGVLKIYGNIEKSAEAIVEPYRSHPKIQFVGFVNDVKQIYRDADFFLLPSLEEGSPLVTYSALGAGLPCLVSPMAGTGVVSDGHTGRIMQPHDEESWVSGIRAIATNDALRESQSKAAWQSAEFFLWKNVGQRRTEQLLIKLNEVT
ncbi:MAG: glycosyltransferase [Methyloglobulus sp.]|nr:glycosyltransferase [Methyloglobulus sp.]